MMTLSKQQKRVMMIMSVLATVVLAIIMIVVVVRLRQIGTEPVAPTAPKSKPEAAGVIPTPAPESACRKTWTIALGPTGTPTPTEAVTPTPTGTLTPTPTGTPGPTATGVPQPTNTPVPGTPGQPTNTPVPLSQGPTVVPTITQQELPEAGSIIQTIGVAAGGLTAIILGILLIL